MLSFFHYYHNPVMIVMIINVIISKPLIMVMVTFTVNIVLYIFFDWSHPVVLSNININ